MVLGTAAKEHFGSIDPINFQCMFLVYAPGEGSRNHQFSLLADPELLTLQADQAASVWDTPDGAEGQ